MKRILGKCLPDKMIPALTSHSLKATLLTYLSKFGCFHTYSELLGYHLTQHQSALNYQRDALAAPIRTMVDMLGAVQNGAFCPAAGRDDMFPSDDCWVTVHVSCTAPATRNSSFQILFKCPTPAIVFETATKPSRFPHF